MILTFCFCINLFFGQQPKMDVVDKWVAEQVTVLSKNETDNPAEQSKALFSLVFISHHVTADETTLPSEWGKVTSDGSATYPIHIDTYDLADRLRRVALEMKWPIQMSETGDGPVMIFGTGQEKQAMIVAQGQYGLWTQLKGKQPLPEGLSADQWSQLIVTRRAELEYLMGKKEHLENLKIDECFAPTLVKGRITRGDDLTSEQLFAWLEKWPTSTTIIENCLKQSRKDNNNEIVEKTIQIGKKNPTVIFFIEAANWYRNQKNRANSIKMLENALKIDPHHGLTNQLIQTWRKN